MGYIKNFLWIFECPKCHKGDLYLRQNSLKCSNCAIEYEIIDGIPDLVVEQKNIVVGKDGFSDVSFSKWDEFYAIEDKQKDDIGFGILLQEHVQAFKNLDILEKISSDEVVLDIGCGKGYIPYGLSKLGKITIGLDFVLEPLLFAKRKFEKENLNGLFIRADMFNLPFKKETFKFVYSLGVLEHHRDIEQPVNEIFRVLKYNGFTFNVVPALSISSLTYGQLWGGIPSLSIFKDIFYWFHFKLLQGKHCIYGFEFNYLECQLKKIFGDSGFKINNSGVFNIAVPIHSIKNDFLKSLAKKIIKNRLFTRHIYIYSKKI